MRKITLLFILQVLFCILTSTAQVNQWVWLKGSNAAGSLGNYGAKGVPSLANEPPAVYEPCEWTDTSGNFWMFGGKDNNQQFRNDLWMYNPGANEWTWMAGTDNFADPGVYGTQGVPSAANHPPPLGFGVNTWVDLNNNLWLCGGLSLASNGMYVDMWEYSIANNEWTWVKGPGTAFPPGVYGTITVPNIANYPGYRCESAASWTDNNGDLWLFGGQGDGNRNDMWRYNIATNTWTWMQGSQYGFVTGTYGTLGVEDPANTPGGRYVYSRWKDNNGNLWLFGGDQPNFYNYPELENDIWRYNVTTNAWTWMGGNMAIDSTYQYGTKCAASATNLPPTRYENRSVWTDAKGNFWMFGGFVNDSIFVRNDLWMYCVSSNQWTWISGDSILNPAGSWGTQGISSPSNVPNGRGGAIGWTGKNGKLYLFGGASYPSYSNIYPYNDVWQYTIDSTCGNCGVVALPVAAFQASATGICQYDCINYTDLSANANSWSWSFAGGTPSSSTDENPQNVCYQSNGAFNVTLVASNSNGTDTITESNYINVFAAPPTPTIIQHSDTLFCSTDPSYTSYQWYDSTAIIPGATDTFLVITQSSNYNIKVTNENGCSTAVGISIILGIKQFTVSGLQFTISPNPVSDELTIYGNGKPEAGNWNLTIFNVLGEKIYTEQINPALAEETINCKPFSAGIYFLRIENENSLWVGRFVKE